MSKVIINSYHEFAALLGKNIGVSDYVELSQERINMFADATLEVKNLKMMVNYGMDKMKFGQAVKSGEHVRLVADLYSIENLRGIAKVQIKFAIEIKESPKKALTGIATFLYYFE